MQIDWWRKNDQNITNQETPIEQTVNKLMIILNQKDKIDKIRIKNIFYNEINRIEKYGMIESKK